MKHRGERKNYILLDGDVRHIDDLNEDVDYDAVEFVDVEESSPDDAEVIDGIMYGYSPENHPEVRLLAQDAFLLLKEKTHLASVRSSIGLHPSSQNVPHEHLVNVADTIIRAYQEEISSLKRNKKAIDQSYVKREVFIAILRNEDNLNEDEIKRIIATFEYDVEQLSANVDSEGGDDREPDFRERQFKD